MVNIIHYLYRLYTIDKAINMVLIIKLFLRIYIGCYFRNVDMEAPVVGHPHAHDFLVIVCVCSNARYQTLRCI